MHTHLTNPLLDEWTTPFGVPPFDRIETEHFLPAYAEAMRRHDAEIAAIASSPSPATFENTIAACDASGVLLSRVNSVFNNLSAAETSPALQEVAQEIAPRLAAHRDDILLNAVLFGRVRAVWESRATLTLAADQAKLLEDTWKSFVRGGARLDSIGQKRLREIHAELASLSVQFGDHLLDETNEFRLVIDDAADLEGLPDRVVAAAAAMAKEKGLDGKWVFTLQAPSYGPFMQYSPRRELRRALFEAYTSKACHGGVHDNRANASRQTALRAEHARLLGYPTHAAFVLDENMAKTPERVEELLDRVWGPAKQVAAREVEAMRAEAKAENRDLTIEPWDWAYYAEKVRQRRYQVEEDAVRPYFPLDRVREGAFWVANKLYGVTFTERKDVPVYHPEVRAWEVKDANGSHLALFLTDDHPRSGKRSGAWSSRFREAWMREGAPVRPILVNVCNIGRPAGGAPALLSLEETETLFHEFGHALHSMLSQVRYRSQGSTPRDFVELPSQIMENWATEPEVLKVYAHHWKTGEVIPDSLIARVKQARKFNQGFATVEYAAASLLDLRWHMLDPKPRDADAFEKETLMAIGMPKEIVPRYRTSYFQHIFAGSYSAGYYSYLWSEVLDADGFQAFKERGIFDPATARSFRTNILEKGGSEDVMELYRRFRGREPSVDPLLERRGLLAVTP
jgi:peptidyl-dipeptidase Dcp